MKTLEITPGVEVSETRTVIRFGANGLALFVVLKDGTEKLAATGVTARRLADYAFGAGAISCRFDYDLSLA